MFLCWLAGWATAEKNIHLVNVNSLCKCKIMHPRARLIYASGGSMRHCPWCWSRTHSLQCISITLHCCIGAQFTMRMQYLLHKREFPCGTCVLQVNNEFSSQGAQGGTQGVSSAIAHFDPFFCNCGVLTLERENWESLFPIMHVTIP